MKKSKKKPTAKMEEVRVKSFLDMIAPSVIKFYTDYFICGNTYRCVWALREYPTTTEEQALLRHLGQLNGVTLHIYTRQVTPTEERVILQNAANKNRMNRSSSNDMRQVVTAENNLQDVSDVITGIQRNREPLLHCAVFIELAASDLDALKLLQTDVLTDLTRSKLNVDRLLLRQQDGFLSSQPAGHNTFAARFELTKEDIENNTERWSEARLYANECLNMTVARALTAFAMGSRANLAMVPMQDYLNLSNEEGRMNIPATAAGNWAWRVSPRYNTEKLRSRVLDLTVKTRRNK